MEIQVKGELERFPLGHNHQPRSPSTLPLLQWLMIWPHRPPRFPPLQPQGPGVVTCTKLRLATISHLPKGDDHEPRSRIRLRCTGPYRHVGPTFPHPSNFAPRSILPSCPSSATPSPIVTSLAPTKIPDKRNQHPLGKQPITTYGSVIRQHRIVYRAK